MKKISGSPLEPPVLKRARSLARGRLQPVEIGADDRLREERQALQVASDDNDAGSTRASSSTSR